MTMLSKILRVVAALICLASPALARSIHGSGSVGANTGYAQLNLGALDPADFLNIFKTTTVTYTLGASPGTAAIDSLGVPTQSFTGNVVYQASGAFWPGSQTIIWEAGAQFDLFYFGHTSGCSFTGTGGSITSGCAGNTATLHIDGTGAGSMTATTDQLGWGFLGTATYGAAGTGKFVIIRTTDLTQYNTYKGTGLAQEYFTPEMLAATTAAKPKMIRPMGWTDKEDVGGNTSTDAQWGNRTQPARINWAGPLFLLNSWSGGTNSSGAITHTSSGACNGSATGELYTAQATPDFPSPSGTPAFGTVVQGVIDTANTTTTPILCWGTTKFPIWSGQYAQAPTIGSPAFIGFAGGTLANKLGAASFVFDPTLGTNGVWLYYHDGLTSTIPVEAQAALANYANADLWVTIPALADDNYVTQLATKMLVMKSWLKAMFEYTNEMWNNQFSQTKWGQARGQAFGFGSGNNEDYHGWYSLRVRQIMGDLIPAVWSGRMSGIRRFMGYQGVSGFTNNNLYRFNSNDLAPSGVHTGIGNALYSSYTGSADYTQFPNRAIDKVESIGYAPYIGGGALLFNGPDIFQGAVPTSDQAPGYQCIVNAQEGGSTAGCLSSNPSVLVDDDIRRGRNKVVTVTCTTTVCSSVGAHGIPQFAIIAFQASGGTNYSNLTDTAVYEVTSTSTSGCAGGVVCNLSFRAFVNGTPGGANINVGSAGTGTVTVGWMGKDVAGVATNFQTLQALANNWHKNAQLLASQYNGARPGGMVDVRIDQYEGSPEPVGPTPAQCAGIGVTSSGPTTTFTATFVNGAGLTGITSVVGTGLIANQVISGTGNPPLVSGSVISNIDFVNGTATLTPAATGNASAVSLTATDNCGTSTAKAITGWKNDTLAKNLMIDYYKQFLGTDSTQPATFGLMGNAWTPAQLVFFGTRVDYNNPAQNGYGLTQGALPNSTGFKLLDGFSQFIGRLNFLLKRDIDPASNDNDPMWLEKAA